MKIRVIFFVFFVSLSSYPLFALAEDSTLDPSRAKWTSLGYKTHVLFFGMKIDVQMNQIPLSTSKAALLTPKHGEGTMPQADPTYRLDMDTGILGRDSSVSLWFDPDGTAFQRTQTDTGKKHRVKTYRILKMVTIRSRPSPGKMKRNCRRTNGATKEKVTRSSTDLHLQGR